MEGEREKEIRVHTIPQTFFMPDPSQPNSISQSMQENHQLEQSSRGICIRNLPALGAMPFTHLLALANAASTSSIDMNSAYLAKSLVDSCRTESSSGTLNPGSSLGLHAGSAGTEKSQYEVSTSQQHFYDLNLLPEEIYNTVPQTEAEFAPITPGKPDKKLPEIPAPFSVAETDQMLQEPAKDSFNAGSAATEKKQKRESHGSCFAAAGKTNQESVKDSFPDAVSAATEQSHKKSKRDRGDVLQIKTPQQKPRRKKHRPKVIIEGKLKRSYKTERKAAEPKQKKSKNRDFDKKDERLTSLQVETVTETSDFKGYSRPKRTTRRALNFHYDILQENENFEFISRSDSELQQQENLCSDTANDFCTSSLNQVQDDENNPGGEEPVISFLIFSTIPKKRRRSSPSNEYDNDREIEQISDCGDQEHIARALLPVGHENSMLTEARPAGESKNTDMASNDQRNTSRDSLQFQCKSLHMFQTMFQVRFPNIQRKRRSVGSNIAISSTSAAKDIVQHETITQHIPGMSSSEIRSDYLCSMLPGVRGATIEKPDENLPREVHTPQWLAESNHSKKLRRKRSKTITRARNFRSLKRILKGILPAQDRAASDKPQRLEAIVSEMQSTVSRKKRTKRNSIMSRLHARRLQIQWRAHLRHRPTSFLKSIGTSPDGLCKTLFSIDTICEWFEQLEINRESPYIRQNALILHRTRHQERNSLVLCRRDGSIIPYGRFSYPPRRKLPRPMVMLDDETTRVWKLLMVNINSEGIDGTNEEKEKWWGEERTVFHGRANSFIARMRLVQGDRRFSPWKGSVVDSVIGVFLTQNVSDHLSSSAFMAMAAEFPNKLNSNKRPCNEEWGSSLTHEPLLYLEDSGDVGSAPSIFNPSGIIVHEINHEEDNDAVSSDETSTISGSFTSSTGESRVLPLNSPKNGLETNFSSETKEHGEDKGEILEPSQDSLTYQDSKNLRLEINVDTTGLCSTSKTEKRDCTDGFSLNSSVYPCSELLDPSQGTIQQRHGRGSISQLDSISVNKLFLLETAERESQIPNNYQIHSSQGISTISSSPPTSQFVLNQDMLDNSEPLRNKTVEDSGLMSNYQQEENYVLQSQNKEGNRRLEKLVHTERSLREILGMTENTSLHENQLNIQSETSQSEMEQMRPSRRNDRKKTSTSKSKGRTTRNEKDFDWDSLRRQAENGDLKRERTARTMDSVDWEAVRCADVDKIAKTIRPRGMNNMLSERIKDFLHRLVREHGSIDLEWLRDIPPDKAKEYLLSIKGLGLKSVECVRLLTLHHLAFPVDTNVGRIAVRLGWVPLQPLPESLQLHLLELYPILESIQQYLWPRLCKLDQETLYQLHYHMITFGKVFCTKSKPNCNACPLRGECRHFASAFASARLALPGPEEKRIIRADEREAKPEPVVVNFQQSLFLPPGTDRPQTMQTLEALNPEAKSECKNCEPIIEEPATPEPECTQELAENDIEDISCDDAEEIPTIRLNMEAFTKNLQNLQMSTELREGDLSKALVALSTEAASTPMPKLKNFSRLRTEHQVYELPDSHRLLERLDKREPDDPCSYLLAIWTPGETANSIQPPEKRCVRRENNTLCQEKTCFSCNSIREEKSQIVRGTLLIPCRTAMRGSFPLNGTYFQVNEVFADHGSSLNPIEVPRDWIWNLRRRTVYFGTSITAIFRGLTTEAIQRCFWRGYVCVRGFDQKTRAPRPLMARLHFPASKQGKRNFRTNEDED